jgi:hypothetical protein
LVIVHYRYIKHILYVLFFGKLLRNKLINIMCNFIMPSISWAFLCGSLSDIPL